MTYIIMDEHYVPHMGLNRAQRRANRFSRKSSPMCTKKHTKCRIKYQVKK